MISDLISNEIHISEIHPGDQETLSFTINETDQKSFAVLSGDFHPIHFSARFAQNHGFRTCVVFGGLIVAKVSQLLGMRLPGQYGLSTGINIQFRKPLYVGQSAHLHAKVEQVSLSTQMIIISFQVQSEDGCVAEGVAEALMIDGKK